MIISAQNPDYSKIPRSPGCYIYKDEEGNIIYIGKAKNLVNRIRSYFSGTDQSIKTRHLVSKIRSVDWIVVDNEVEALLLENNLIKQHKPRYNIDLKDNKRYAYIKITSEKYPRILSARQVTKDGSFFGPYTDGYQRVQLLRTAVSIFKIRTCVKLPKHACLNFHIGICTAPCINNVTQEQYSEQVERAKEFLKHNIEPTVKQLTQEMHEFSKEQKYEKALERKQQLEAISMIYDKQKVELIKSYDQDVVAQLKHNEFLIIEIFTVRQGVIFGKQEFRLEYSEDAFEEFLRRYYASKKIPFEIIINHELEDKSVLEEYLMKLRNAKVMITVPEKGEKKELIELALKNAYTNLEENKALVELKEALNMPQYPKVIECFDVSNLGHEHIVAAMTRFVDARKDRSGYRKFLIRSTVGKQDDFAAMGEAVFRRYQRLKMEKGPYPDLIMIDGGLGHLNMALRSLKALGLKISIIAIAKGEEEIYTPNDPMPLRFDKNGKMMLLLREIRDSVHDFVLGYNRKRRQMKMREEFKQLDKDDSRKKD